MVIAHICPFAPNRCGLYEHARDMIKADTIGGNEAFLIDTGVFANGKFEEPVIGGIDDRAGFEIITQSAEKIEEADVIIGHMSIPDSWLIRNQTPIIYVVHGRPLASFRIEGYGKGTSYSLYSNVASWKRTKKMLYFWEEFEPYWKPFFHGKDLILDPVVDENRFKQDGEKYELKDKGKYNLLVCDSEREDIDLFEMCIGLIHACNQIQGLKVHFFGLGLPLKKPMQIVFNKLEQIGGLGDVVGRIEGIEKVYRSVDCLISPNRIAVRTIGEALCCGIPVISELNCKYADYTCYMADTKSVVSTVKQLISDFDNNNINKIAILERSKAFNMANYYTKMNKVYEEVLA